MADKSKEQGKPFGLRLPPSVILEFKQEALKRGMTASALFQQVWNEAKERDK